MATDTARRAAAPETPLFSATLTPHRSLSPAGFRAVMTLVALGALVQGVAMTLAGAWPVGWFLGLDVAIVYFCFRLSFARARRTEHIELSRVDLTIRRYGWRGEVSEIRFNPFWVRLRTVEDPDYGTQRVLISQRRQELEVGAFLAPFEKADFARALGGALARARG